MMKQEKGDSPFVPSEVESLAAERVVAGRASDLEWQLKKVQAQMNKMKEQADKLEAEREVKVEVAEQECVVAEANRATARSSGSLHNEVWDGSLNTMGKHLLAMKEAGEAILQHLLHDLNEAKVRAEEGGPHGKLSMTDMCGFLSTLHTCQGLMSAEAKRRQVIPSPDELQDIERSPLGAEVLFWVMEVHDEKASHFEATRISMAEAMFKKAAEERPGRHGLVIPGCWHTCGGTLRTHHRGHGDSKGKAYESRTRRHATSWESSRQQVHA